MSGAREQVGRLLALVPWIQARREVSLEEAAAEFGVKPTQIVKDLKVLWFCGLPGLGMGDLIEVDMDALEGEGVIRVSNADYLTRPLRLDSGEASALIVALRTLRETAGDDVRPVVDRTLAKLEAAAGDGAAAVELTRRTHPHVVLMDVQMPGTDGIAATTQIVRNHPATRVVVLDPAPHFADVDRGNDLWVARGAPRRRARRAVTPAWWRGVRRHPPAGPSTARRGRGGPAGSRGYPAAARAPVQ